MKIIIDPINKELIKKELTKDSFLMNTKFANREIHIVSGHQAPNTLLEIGRLREISFRNSGGGTGKEFDVDDFDTMESPYKQLVLWDPEDEEIVGGYRFIEGARIALDRYNKPILSTGEIFNFSPSFIKDYLPYTIELGRSFVRQEFQSKSSSRKGLYSLDNLWDGVAGLCAKYKGTAFLFGKITMYTCFNKEARDTILYFLNRFFPDNEKLVTPIEPIELASPEEELSKLYTGHESVVEAYKLMNKKVRSLGENIPPMFSAYIKTSSTMKSFGTAINHHFGGVEETGIMISLSEINESQRERYFTNAQTKMKSL